MCVRNESGAGDGRPTIIDAALDRERPFLPPEEADAEILKLHRQVGQLEERGAVLERVVKTLCRHYCGLQDNGYCDLLCPGRDYCDTEGLAVINLGGKRQEERHPTPPLPPRGGRGKRI